MNKEEVYDSQISPLMQQIIAITRQHGIAMIASFAIDHDGEGPNGEDCTLLTCSTHLPDGDGEHDPRFHRAIQQIQTNRSPLMFTTTHADGSATMTAVI